MILRVSTGEEWISGSGLRNLAAVDALRLNNTSCTHVHLLAGPNLLDGSHVSLRDLCSVLDRNTVVTSIEFDIRIRGASNDDLLELYRCVSSNSTLTRMSLLYYTDLRNWRSTPLERAVFRAGAESATISNCRLSLHRGNTDLVIDLLNAKQSALKSLQMDIHYDDLFSPDQGADLGAAISRCTELEDIELGIFEPSGGLIGTEPPLRGLVDGVTQCSSLHSLHLSIFSCTEAQSQWMERLVRQVGRRCTSLRTLAVTWETQGQVISSTLIASLSSMAQSTRTLTCVKLAIAESDITDQDFCLLLRSVKANPSICEFDISGIGSHDAGSKSDALVQLINESSIQDFKVEWDFDSPRRTNPKHLMVAQNQLFGYLIPTAKCQNLELLFPHAGLLPKEAYQLAATITGRLPNLQSLKIDCVGGVAPPLIAAEELPRTLTDSLLEHSCLVALKICGDLKLRNRVAAYTVTRNQYHEGLHPKGDFGNRQVVLLHELGDLGEVGLSVMYNALRNQDSWYRNPCKPPKQLPSFFQRKCAQARKIVSRFYCSKKQDAEYVYALE